MRYNEEKLREAVRLFTPEEMKSYLKSCLIAINILGFLVLYVAYLIRDNRIIGVFLPVLMVINLWIMILMHNREKLQRHIFFFGGVWGLLFSALFIGLLYEILYSNPNRIRWFVSDIIISFISIPIFYLYYLNFLKSESSFKSQNIKKIMAYSTLGAGIGIVILRIITNIIGGPVADIVIYIIGIFISFLVTGAATVSFFRYYLTVKYPEYVNEYSSNIGERKRTR